MFTFIGFAPFLSLGVLLVLASVFLAICANSGFGGKDEVVASLFFAFISIVVIGTTLYFPPYSMVVN